MNVLVVTRTQIRQCEHVWIKSAYFNFFFNNCIKRNKIYKETEGGQQCVQRGCNSAPKVPNDLKWNKEKRVWFERIVLHALTNLRRGLYSTLLPYYYNVHSSDKNQIRQGHNISILMSWISHIFNIMTSKPFWAVNLNF